MPHLVPDLRHRIVVRRYLSVCRLLRQLMCIGSNIVDVRFVKAVRRILLHLVGADIDGLDELPLKPAAGTGSGHVSLLRADAGYLAACGPSAQRPGAGGPS